LRNGITTYVDTLARQRIKTSGGISRMFQATLLGDAAVDTNLALPLMAGNETL
jgi:hypothetical protein